MKKHILILSFMALLVGCEDSKNVAPPAGGSTETGKASLAEVTNLSVTAATDSKLRFEWEDFAEDVTYEVCRGEVAQGSGCDAIAEVVGVGQAEVVVDDVISAATDSYYVRASLDGESLDSTEAQLDGDTVNVWTQYTKFMDAGLPLNAKLGSYVISENLDVAALRIGDDRVVVYHLNDQTGEWEKRFDQLGSDTTYGYKLALNGVGDTLAITEAGFNSDQGRVSVYRYDGSAWALDEHLVGNGVGAGEKFGQGEISFNRAGDQLVVGMGHYAKGGRGVNPSSLSGDVYSGGGAIFVFTHDGTWSQTAFIRAEEPGQNRYFGGFVKQSQSGDLLITMQSSLRTQMEARLRFIYRKDDQGNWALEQTLPDMVHHFSVSDDGGNERIFFAQTGCMYAFDGATWAEESCIVSPFTGNQLGITHAVMAKDATVVYFSVIVDNSAAKGVNGDPYNQDTFQTGAVYKTEYVDGQWQHRSYIKSIATEDGDKFGRFLQSTPDGKRLAVIGEDLSVTSDDPENNDSSVNTTSMFMY